MVKSKRTTLMSKMAVLPSLENSEPCHMALKHMVSMFTFTTAVQWLASLKFKVAVAVS